MSDLKKYLISSGQNSNAVNEAATAVIAQMGRAKAMERPQPIPKKLPMVGVQKKTAVKKPVVKKPVKKVKQTVQPKTVSKKQVKPVNQQVKAKNVKPINGKNGKNLKTEKGKDVAKKPGNKWLLIFLIILIVLLIAAAAGWYFFLR